MTEGLHDIRERIYLKGHDYFVYERKRFDRRKWGIFWGAMDAFHESSNALREYAAAVRAGCRTLACYGFLQALYVQQDAVGTLSKAVGLRWHPDDDPRLGEIREARNRITGHPAEARGPSRKPELSSAIIPERDVTETGFRGHVYFERRIEDVWVDVETFCADNEERLAIQMRMIEEKMTADEEAFRGTHRARPLSAPFDLDLAYFIRTLSCELGHESERIKAGSNAGWLLDHMKALESDLADRGFANEATKHDLGLVFWGLDRIRTIMADADVTASAQQETYLLKIGVEHCLIDLEQQVRAIDEKIRQVPA